MCYVLLLATSDDIMNDMYEGRYCYQNHADAKEALEKWTGVSDPQDEDWIKHKGKNGEWLNKKVEL